MASSAVQWGRNLISSFAKGIASAAGKVIAKAKEVAATVKSYLGFSSPTEKGPGSTSDHWAPNLMNMFSSGIQAGIPKLRMAVTEAATVVSEMDSNRSAPTSNRTQNITFNNYGSDQPSEKVIEDQFRRMSYLYG